MGDDIRATENSLARVERVCKVLNVLIWIALILYSLFFAGMFLASIIPLLSLGGFLTAASTEIILLVESFVKSLPVPILLILVSRMFYGISKGEPPFTLRQAKRLRWMALILVVFTIFDALASPGVLALLSVGNLDILYAPEMGVQTSVVPINLGFLFTSALFFCFSYVFEYGVLLQKLSDETL